MKGPENKKPWTRRTALTGVFALLEVALVVTGCQSGPLRTPGVGGLDSAATHVTVRNGNYDDVKLRVETDGGRWMLGAIRSGDVRTFTLPKWTASSPDFRLIAELVSGRGELRSLPVPQTQGMQVEWTVGAYERTSLLTVRSR